MKNNKYNKHKYYNDDVSSMIYEKRRDYDRQKKHKNICDYHEDGA